MKTNNFLILALLCAFQISTKKTDAISESEKFAITLLTKFGYRKTLSPITNSTQMKNMLTSFQKFYGLKQTGTLTDETLEALKKPRCGLPDPWDLHEKNPNADYVLQGTKWKTKTTITWKIIENFSILENEVISDTFKRAFSRWQKHTEKLKFMESSTLDDVDISIQIVGYRHGDPYPFDRIGGSLGHSFYPLQEIGLAGDIHLDADDVNVKYDTNLDWLATHLIGHSLGIMHNGKHDSVMFPYRKDKEFLNKTFELPEPDIKAIKALYGKEAVLTTMQPPVNPCPNLDMSALASALVYDEFDKRLLVFTKSDRLMIIDSGHVTAIIPMMQVDAALMKGKNYMIIFSGKRYFTYHIRYFNKIAGPLKLKLPKHVTKIDAAMRREVDGNLYLFSKATVYKYDVTSSRIKSMQRISDSWKGVPDNIDAAFSSNGRTYFVKNDMIYEFDNKKMKVKKGYPQHWGKVILNCQQPPSIPADTI